jgi:putative membrane protein
MERNYNRKFPTTIIGIIAVVIAVAVIVMAVFAYSSSRNPNYGYGGYGGYGGMMGGFGGYWMLFMIPIGLIVLVIIGYVIWRAVGWGGGCCENGHNGHYNSYGARENAMEIIRQRYARGEISKEQYEQMKKDIVG